MAHARRHFAGLLFMLFAIAVDQLRIPMVTCQEGDDTQCLPRKTFFAFLRLPEVSSNLAAYSRTARIIQDARNDFVHLKALSAENSGDDPKICLPAVVYFEIFSDPAMRAHLSAIERAQRMVEDPETLDYAALDAEKRSIATLAKNDDLPVSIHNRDHEGEDDEEKRSQSSMAADELLKMYVGHAVPVESLGKSAEDIISEYTLPNGDIDVASLARDYHSTKRNVAALARDYALPAGHRKIDNWIRDYSYATEKRNIASLARDRMLPKKNVASLGQIYIYPSLRGNKRNIATLARDFALPQQGKRYIGAIMRNGGFSTIYQKRSIASLARNGMLSNYNNYLKRNVGTLARDWSLPQTRHGRSLNEQNFDGLTRANFDNIKSFDQMKLENDGNNKARNGGSTTSVFEAELVDAKNKSRAKRQIDYSDEYPLPVMQNTNVFDYDDIVEALAGYPNAEKRFMGAGSSSEWPNDDGDDDTVQTVDYHDMSQPSKRHIGALARLGWLPSFRAARFSRSPRYLVGREDSSDGTTSDDSTHSSSWSLSSFRIRSPRTRNVQTLQGDCRHNNRRYFLLPSNDINIDHSRLHRAPANI